MVSRAVIKTIQEERNPNTIQAAHVKGYDSPGKISVKGVDEEYVPDIAAIFDNSTTVYSIELNESMHAEKWRVLSLYALKCKGNLYLVVPDYLKESIKEEIKEEEINAGVIYFNT